MSPDRRALTHLARSTEHRTIEHRTTTEHRSTRARRSGARDERRVGETLSGLGEVTAVLHGRTDPARRVELDHVVVGATGVFVVGAEHHHRTDVSVHRSGGIRGPVQEQLMVGGRDRTTLADAARLEAEVVRAALDDAPLLGVAVTAVLCFVDAQFPLFTRLEIAGVRVVGLRGLGKLVAGDGPLDAAARDTLARHLAVRLPVA